MDESMRILEELARESRLEVPEDDGDAPPQRKLLRPTRIVVEDGGDNDFESDDFEDGDEEVEVRDVPASASTSAPVRRGPGRPRKQPPAITLPPPDEQSDSEADMGRRRRQQNAMNAQHGRPQKEPTVTEVPSAAIEAARDHFDSVVVKLSQRNGKGHLGHVGVYQKSIDELLQIEEWLRMEHGGGHYNIAVKDPQNPSMPAGDIPSFEVRVMGPQRVAVGQPQMFGGGFGGPPMFGGGVPGMPPPPPIGAAYVDPKNLPPYVRGFSNDAQVDWARSNGVPVTTAQPPGFTMPVMQNTPDELMRVELKHAQDEIARERAELRQRELQHKKELEAQQKKLEEITKTLEQQRRDAEKRETDARFEQIMQQNKLQTEMLVRDLNAAKAAPVVAPKGVDLAGLAAILGAVAPVVAAMVESSRTHATKSIELQSSSMTELMKATVAKADNKPMFEMFLKLLPLATPILVKYMEGKSPAAQADLVASLAENNLTSISFMAKMVSEMGGGGGPEAPWYMPMIEQTLNGLVKATESLGAANRRAVGLPAQQQVQQLPRQTPAQAAAQEPVQQAPWAEAPLNPTQLTGEQIANLIWQDPTVPADIKTPGWFNIVKKLHERAPVEEVAEDFEAHLLEIDPDDGTGIGLPLVMSGFWDQSETVMRRVFGVLPIAQMDPAYLNSFIETVFQNMSNPRKPGETPGDSRTQKQA